MSRRIEDEAERQRLRDCVESMRGMGIIADRRQGAAREELIRRLRCCRPCGAGSAAADFAIAPQLVHRDSDLLLRTVRDMFSDDVESFAVSGEGAAARVREMVSYLSPELLSRIRALGEDDDVFDIYGIEGQVKKCFVRKVWLKSGGTLIFDQTEALTAIDVNTGKCTGASDLETTIFRTNMEAAVEIARQIRLRTSAASSSLTLSICWMRRISRR